MRTAALALIALAGGACGRRTLQADAGTSTGTFDAIPGGDGPGAIDGPGAVDVPSATDVRLPTPDANCGIKTYRSERLPYDFMLVVDRALADPSSWNQLVFDLADIVRPIDMEIAWGLKIFPEDGPACGAGTVTDRIDVPIAVKNGPPVLNALARTTPDGNGTPTAAAIAAALAYLKSVNDVNPKFLMLVTDGAPSCAGAAGALSGDPAQALADATAAIAAAYADGYPTLVAGAGITAETDVDALNRLADAGGYPRLGVNRFYPLSNPNELRTMLTPIHESSCTFPLPQPPPATESILVSIDGVVIPRDASHQNGWDYTSRERTSFAFYGTACERIIEAWAVEVQIIYACF